MKRFISLLLCLCMVFGFSSVVYGASSSTYVNTYYAPSQNVILKVSRNTAMTCASKATKQYSRMVSLTPCSWSYILG